MRKLPLILILLLLSNNILFSQGRGTPSTLLVKVDANGYLLVSSATQTNPITQGTFSTRVLKTDSNGALQVVLTGTVTPTYPQAIPASTCAAPSLGLSGNTDNGIAFTNDPSILNCIEAAIKTTLTASLYTVAVDTRINGGLGINTSETDDGDLTLTGTILRFVDGANNSVWRTTNPGVDNTMEFGTIANADIKIFVNNDEKWKFFTSGKFGNTTAGTVFTTNDRLFDTTVEWNNGAVTFTGWKLDITDTASASASLLMDLQVASSSVFRVLKTGGFFSNSGGDIAGALTVGGVIQGRSSRTELLLNITNGHAAFRDNAEAFGIQFNTGTAAPTVGTCGTGTITANSRNTAGGFTATGATACTVTFGTPAWTNTPFCVVTLRNAPTTTPYISAISTTAFTVSGLTADDVIAYNCIGPI